MTSSPIQLRFGGLFLVVLAAVLSADCRGGRHVDGTVATDTILAIWGGEGFPTTDVASTDPNPWTAGACTRGVVAGLDVLLCEYASDEELVTGERKMMSVWQAESVTTGVAVRTSRTLVAITDRASADPSGRTIARLIKSLRERR